MYSITKFRKDLNGVQFDYTFNKFSDFYKIADVLYLPLMGVYKIAVITTDIEDVQNFIKVEDKYSHLSVSIFMEESALSVIEETVVDAYIEETINSYEVFKRMITERNLLFDRYMIYKLYRSIEHDTVSLMTALDKLLEEYGAGELLTEEKISRLFVINNITYPSQVLVKFINMENNRWRLLDMCLSQIDNDVLVGSVCKEIRKLTSEKAEYFKTGDGADRIKKLNTRNLLTAYSVFISERKGINDAFILFKLYESGISQVDLLGGKNVSIQ